MIKRFPAAHLDATGIQASGLKGKESGRHRMLRSSELKTRELSYSFTTKIQSVGLVHHLVAILGLRVKNFPDVSRYFRMPPELQQKYSSFGHFTGSDQNMMKH